MLPNLLFPKRVLFRQLKPIQFLFIPFFTNKVNYFCIISNHCHGSATRLVRKAERAVGSINKFKEINDTSLISIQTTSLQKSEDIVW